MPLSGPGLVVCGWQLYELDCGAPLTYEDEDNCEAIELRVAAELTDENLESRVMSENALALDFFGISGGSEDAVERRFAR